MGSYTNLWCLSQTKDHDTEYEMSIYSPDSLLSVKVFFIKNEKYIFILSDGHKNLIYIIIANTGILGHF